MLTIAAVCGLTLNWAGFPAGLVTGSLLGVAIAALCGRPVHIPVPLSRVISVVVGISLGAVVTPATLKGLAAFPLSVAVLAVSTLCMITATSSYLRFVHGWDAQSALEVLSKDTAPPEVLLYYWQPENRHCIYWR